MTDITGTGSYLGNFYGIMGTAAVGHFPLDALTNMNPAWPDGLLTWVPNIILDTDPDMKLVMVPAIGEGGNRRYMNTPFREASNSVTFGYGVAEEDKFQRALALFRYTHFDEEAWHRYYYGIEGVHYQWAGEPHKSAVVATDFDKIPVRYTSSARQGIFATDRFLYDFHRFAYASEWFYQLCEFQVEHNWYGLYTLEPDKLILRPFMGDDLFDEYIDLRDEFNSDIMTIANDFRNRAFDGEIADIYAEWSEYIDTLYRAGFDRYVEIFNNDDFRMYDVDVSDFYTLD